MPRNPSAIRFSCSNDDETEERDRILESADNGRIVDPAEIRIPPIQQNHDIDRKEIQVLNQSPHGQDVIPLVSAAVYDSNIQFQRNPAGQQRHQQPFVVHTSKETIRNPDGSAKIVTEFTYSDGSKSRTEEILVNQFSPRIPHMCDEEASSEILPNERNRHDRNPPTGHPTQPRKLASERQTCRDTTLIVTVILACLMIAGLAVGLGIGLLSSSSSKNDIQLNITLGCTLCYGGSTPADSSMDFSPSGPTCKDLDISTYGQDDDECHQIQSQAYYACGCPALPPVRASPLCSLCADGTFPPPKADEVIDHGEIMGWDKKFRNITCEAEAVRISYEEPKAGSIPFSSCKGFQDGFGSVCGCPGAPLLATESTKCTLCYGGAPPADLTLEYFPGSVTCGDYDTSVYESDDDECLGINAQAYWMCGCPELPPVRATPLCSLCPDGTFPPPNADEVVDYGAYEMEGKYRNITCEAQAVRISYAEPTTGWIPFTSCQGFQGGFGSVCGCPTSP